MNVIHLDDEQVQRFLHGELAPAGSALTSDHLGVCEECRSRIELAEREENRALGLLRHLDHPVPRADVHGVMAARRRPGRSLARWAASILLVVAVGGAAYAAPGSPIPALVDRLVRPSPPGRDRTAPPATPNADTTTAPLSPVTQGIAAEPGTGFTIAFSSRQPGSVAVVSLTDSALVAVRAMNGAATFTADIDGISIGNGASSAGYEIDIPRNAPRVEIRVAGRRVFLKSASGITSDGDRDSDGRYVVPLE